MRNRNEGNLCLGEEHKTLKTTTYHTIFLKLNFHKFAPKIVSLNQYVWENCNAHVTICKVCANFLPHNTHYVVKGGRKWRSRIKIAISEFQSATNKNNHFTINIISFVFLGMLGVLFTQQLSMLSLRLGYLFLAVEPILILALFSLVKNEYPKYIAIFILALLILAKNVFITAQFLSPYNY